MSHGEKFVITHPMPTREQRIAEMQRKLDAGEPLGASHVPTILPGIFVAGTIMPSDKPRWPCPRGKPVRKSHNRNGSACHGKDVPCLPGLNGKCVACFDDD